MAAKHGLLIEWMKDDWKQQRCESCGIYTVGQGRDLRNKVTIMNAEFGQINTRKGGGNGCGIYRRSIRKSSQATFILSTDRKTKSMKTKKNMAKWLNI
jgi:hypothetical protein